MTLASVIRYGLNQCSGIMLSIHQPLVGPNVDLPYQVGALYIRKSQIHGVFGGQRQGGISTPREHPLVIAFTGEAGASHGYQDFWDDDEIFHYFGEGQIGDMRYVAGNRAIEDHVKEGKRLIIFQMMGKGRPYRYLGEFIALSSYIRPNTPDTLGNLRNAIVFRLRPLDRSLDFATAEEDSGLAQVETNLNLGDTAKTTLVEVRTKQQLFRDRLIGCEKGCRITGVEDLRFLRASHIKPWSKSTAGERVDGQNGLLLAPHADHLFDRGWISFSNDGRLLVAGNLPSNVEELLKLDLKRGRRCGTFTARQREYLDFHRDIVFEKHLKKKQVHTTLLAELDQAH